jgi:GDP-4-dehydro-6-deoxy-D-mannose reductase
VTAAGRAGASERRALVTGASGFVGGWLVRALVAEGWSVHATSTTLPVPSDALPADAVRWTAGDVRDGAHLARLLDAARPDAIVHLAAISHIPEAARDPGLTAEVNVVAAARLLALVRERRDAGTMDPVVLVVGSGEQYGRQDAAALPLTEDAEQRPRTVYAATKTAQEAIALEAWRGEGVRVIATRSFNHSGPGQHPRFLLPGLVGRAHALAERSRGGERALALAMGNQAPVRDFLHVSDVVAAYIALVAQGRPGEVYNVCSGQAVSVGALARRVLARIGLECPVVSDPALVRPADVPALVGSAAKLVAHTGWAPRHTLDDLLDELIRDPQHDHSHEPRPVPLHESRAAP